MRNINKFVHVLKQEIIKNVTTNFHKLKIYVQEIVIKKLAHETYNDLAKYYNS